MTKQRLYYRSITLFFLCIPSLLAAGEKDIKISAQSGAIGTIQQKKPVKFFVHIPYLTHHLEPLGSNNAKNELEWGEGGSDLQGVANPKTLYQYAAAIVSHSTAPPYGLQLKIVVNAQDQPVAKKICRYRIRARTWTNFTLGGAAATALGTAAFIAALAAGGINNPWTLYIITGTLSTLLAGTIVSAGTAYYYRRLSNTLYQQLCKNVWALTPWTSINTKGQPLLTPQDKHFATSVILHALLRKDIQKLIIRIAGDADIKTIEKNKTDYLPITLASVGIETQLTDFLTGEEVSGPRTDNIED